MSGLLEVRGNRMPTILRIVGYRFFFFSNERGEPPHVHVERADAYARIWLQPIEVVEAIDFRPSEVRRIRELTIRHWTTFMEKWNEHLGQ